MQCNLCFHEEFNNLQKFRGTTKRYENIDFTYGKCKKCDSIINLDLKYPDYSSYITGNTISQKKCFRFINFLKKNGLFQNKDLFKILDYGCGNGALLKALKGNGFSVDGYEPFNDTYSNTINNGEKYSLIYLTHVFEHVPDYNVFFENLNKFTKSGSLILTIHPSSSRIDQLDPFCPFQNFTIHAPFHTAIPSDSITLKMFSDHGFKLKLFIPYDIQRSGLKDNNRVTALLADSVGGLKENWLNTNNKTKFLTLLNSPFLFLNSMFIKTNDNLVSTFVFEKI